MSEHLDITRANERLWGCVVLVLTMVEKDGAPFQRANLADEETIALYVKDCAAMKLMPEMVWSARDDVRHRRKADGELAAFPRPQEFADCVAAHVAQNWKAITTVVSTDLYGVDTCSLRYVAPDSPAWQRHKEALKKAQEQEQLALPGEVREEAKARLDAMLENPPVRRMPAALRERTEKVDETDPEIVAKREQMVADLRDSEEQP